MSNDGGGKPHVQMTTGPYMTTGAQRAARRLAYSLMVLFVWTIILGAGSFWFTLDQAAGQRAADSSACAFFGHLAGLPVTVNPATGKALLLGVEIISDSRVAWRGRGCPGKLPPPSPSFQKWARYYRLPHR